MASAAGTTLLLASASPRRQVLLRESGYRFAIDPANIDEDSYPGALSAGEIATYLAVEKARAVARRHGPAAIVLGADTVVAVGEALLGKPVDEADARRILSMLSGTTHEVVTGVALARGGGEVISRDRIVSRVQMRVMLQTEIDAYVLGGEWRGKAGGYGLQDDDPFVTRLEGSWSNIVGLPMERVRQMLAEVGIVPSIDPVG